MPGLPLEDIFGAAGEREVPFSVAGGAYLQERGAFSEGAILLRRGEIFFWRMVSFSEGLAGRNRERH